MEEMNNEVFQNPKHRVALFRFGVIADFVKGELKRGEKEKLLKWCRRVGMGVSGRNKRNSSSRILQSLYIARIGDSTYLQRVRIFL